MTTLRTGYGEAMKFSLLFDAKLYNINIFFIAHKIKYRNKQKTKDGATGGLIAR